MGEVLAKHGPSGTLLVQGEDAVFICASGARIEIIDRILEAITSTRTELGNYSGSNFVEPSTGWSWENPYGHQDDGLLTGFVME